MYESSVAGTAVPLFGAGHFFGAGLFSGVSHMSKSSSDSSSASSSATASWPLGTASLSGTASWPRTASMPLCRGLFFGAGPVSKSSSATARLKTSWDDAVWPFFYFLFVFFFFNFYFCKAVVKRPFLWCWPGVQVLGQSLGHLLLGPKGGLCILPGSRPLKDG